MTETSPNTGTVDLPPQTERESGCDSEPQMAPAPSGSWAHLFSAEHRTVVVVLASGVGLYAMNLYFIASLMPSIVTEIGGAHLYAWTSTAYLITAVIATLLVARLLGTIGAGRSYALALALFTLGTAASATAPSMEWFVTGRAVQGMGAGALTGLGYAVIRTTLPAELWTRSTGLISGMFGVGTLIGPAIGGLSAQLGFWRGALWLLCAVSIVLILVSLKALGFARPERIAQPPLPLLSMLLLAAVAALLSFASTSTGIAVPLLLAGSVLAIVAFFWLDRRTPHGVLPRATYQRGNSLKWIYLTVAALCAGVTVENFIPLYAQQLAGVTPLIAGIIGAVLSVGWTSAQLISVNYSGASADRIVRFAPWLLSLGLVAYGALQVSGAGTGTVALWAFLLFVAGAGVGLAFPHLSAAAMRSSTDPVEGVKASAAMSTTQLIAFTLTSAIAGNLMTLGNGVPVAEARWVILGVAALSLIALFAAPLATRGGAQGSIKVS